MGEAIRGDIVLEAGEFSSRKRGAGTVTDSRIAEKYGARAKFCARFTRPD